METDEEVHGKKELDERKKKLRKQLRALEKFTDMEQRLVDEQKEKWQQEFQNGMICCGTPKDADKTQTLC